MSKLTVERKGPHKSMHCKFCRPPDPLLPEKLSQSHLETTTKLRVAHEAVDLRLVNVDEEVISTNKYRIGLFLAVLMVVFCSLAYRLLIVPSASVNWKMKIPALNVHLTRKENLFQRKFVIVLKEPNR